MNKIKTTYCLIAKSIPEYSKRDNVLYTCSIGVSPDLGLIRVYPLPITQMKKWGIYGVELEKNKYDSRKESWKLGTKARKNGWKGFEYEVKQLGTFNKSKLSAYLSKHIYPSIEEMNRLRLSIGIIPLNDYVIKWEANKRFINDRQIGLFEDVELADHCAYTKDSKQKESRIKFKDGDGLHDIQYNSWDVYEYQRKFGAKNDAFRFCKGTHLLVGNMHNFRNNWIGLGVLTLTPQPTLF